MPSTAIKEKIMKYTIDRFEGEYAVVELEDKTMIDIPKCALPVEANEGDIISVEIDKDETEKRKQYINKLMNDIWAD
jgi:hypothetical protein